MNSYTKKILYITIIIGWIMSLICISIIIEYTSNQYYNDIHNTTCYLLNNNITIINKNKIIVLIDVTQIRSISINITTLITLQFQDYIKAINFTHSFPRQCYYYNNDNIIFWIPSYLSILIIFIPFYILSIPPIIILIISFIDEYKKSKDELQLFNQDHRNYELVFRHYDSL